MGERLHAIADSQNGKPGFENKILDIGRILFIDRARSAREDESLRRNGEDPVHGRVPGKELAIDLGFANAPGNDLRILGTEIEDGDGVHKFPIPVRTGVPC